MLWPAVAVAVAVVRLVRLRPLPVGRRRPAAAAEGFVGGAHGAVVEIPADELGARVGGRRRGPGGVSAAGARVASSALQGERV